MVWHWLQGQFVSQDSSSVRGQDRGPQYNRSARYADYSEYHGYPAYHYESFSKIEIMRRGWIFAIFSFYLLDTTCENFVIIAYLERKLQAISEHDMTRTSEFL